MFNSQEIKLKLKPTVRYYSFNDQVNLQTSGFSFQIDDKDGLISSVIELLDGTNTVESISSKIRKKFPKTNNKKINDMISSLDEARLIENSELKPNEFFNKREAERWSRNFNFLGAYISIRENKFEKQNKIKKSKVCLLGLGGLGSHILYDLVALGVVNITAVDFDLIDLSNLNRQILYHENDIGRPKHEAAEERILSFNPFLNANFINKKIEREKDLEEIIEGHDIVICVADKPRMHMANWVNEACCKHKIPLITGGLNTRQAIYYTILPNETGCVECWKQHVSSNDALSKEIFTFDKANDEFFDIKEPAPAIVPFVSLLTGFIVAEYLKITTKISHPIATNKVIAIDFDTMEVKPIEKWVKLEDCSICNS